MSYCVNCGVELADSEKKCPLCGTEVINPNNKEKKESKSPYPAGHHRQGTQKVSRDSILSLLTTVLMIPILITAICDWEVNGGITWSGYVIGALLCVDIIVALALMCRKFPSWVVIIICSAVIVLYMFYIEMKTVTDFVIPFVLPIFLALVANIVIILLLRRYRGRSYLKISAAAIFLIGLYCIFIEYKINQVFSVHNHLVWSPYPSITCLVIAIILLVIDKSEPIKERLRKKFFI